MTKDESLKILRMTLKALSKQKVNIITTLIKLYKLFRKLNKKKKAWQNNMGAGLVNFRQLGREALEHRALCWWDLALPSPLKAWLVDQEVADNSY